MKTYTQDIIGSSANQAVVALSLGKAEYYSLVKAGSVSLGIKALTSESGIELDNSININADANAAIGVSSRVVSGKMIHIEVTQLRLQEKVRTKMIVNTVSTDDNLSDALTKGRDAAGIYKSTQKG